MSKVLEPDYWRMAPDLKSLRVNPVDEFRCGGKVTRMDSPLLPEATKSAGVTADSLTSNELASFGDNAFRTLFEQSLDAIVMADDEGRYLDANAPACALFGLPRAKMLEMRVGDLMVPTAPASQAQYERYVQTGRETGEFSFVRDGAEIRIASYSACRIAPGRHISILRDITAHKQTEHDLRETSGRLHRAIYESSHRIKNQLQLLSATVDMTLLDGDALIPAGAVKRLGAQIRMLSVLQDILTLEWKSNANGAADTVSSRSMLERVLQILRQTTNTGEIAYTIADIALPINAATSLSLICYEAVANAFKHSGEPNVEVTLHADHGRAVFEVCDDGPGFPEGFNPDTHASTGIELITALTKHDLGGQARYENRTQGGARVLIEFPLDAFPKRDT